MKFKKWIFESHQNTPKILIVGKDIPNHFLHGTKKSTAKTIGQPIPANVTAWRKKQGGMKDQRGAALFLTEPHRPGDALLFSKSFSGAGLFVVTLKPGSKLLDLTQEIGTMATSGDYFKLLQRPAITDDFIKWLSDKYGGTEESAIKASKSLDPNLGSINAYSWILYLIPFAKDQGYAGVRFVDEILITDQKYIDSIRPIRKSEKID